MIPQEQTSGVGFTMGELRELTKDVPDDALVLQSLGPIRDRDRGRRTEHILAADDRVLLVARRSE